MSAAAIGGAAVAATPATSPSRFADIQTDDFIRVLISELANQDPFDPQDSSALLEQLSSLRNIESQLVLQGQIESLVLQNQISLAGTLIGRIVSGLDQNNDSVSGQVTSVRVQNGKAILELEDGQMLAMDHVTRIEAAAESVES
jgi:flagellar basal-body rod modification protein FlgD